MPGPGDIFAELQRRHVVRAAVAHVIVFWLLIQVADVVLPYVGIVDEPVRWALVAGVALFPVTLVVAWFFEHPWHKYTRSRVALDEDEDDALDRLEFSAGDPSADLDELTDELLYHGDVNAALRRMMQEGLRDRNGEQLPKEL